MHGIAQISATEQVRCNRQNRMAWGGKPEARQPILPGGAWGRTSASPAGRQADLDQPGGNRPEARRTSATLPE